MDPLVERLNEALARKQELQEELDAVRALTIKQKLYISHLEQNSTCTSNCIDCKVLKNSH